MAIKDQVSKKLLMSLLFWTPSCTLDLLQAHYLKPDEIIKYQEKKLRAIVKHSYENVWYYNQLFKKINITPDDIKSSQDLKKIPVTEKKDIRDLPLEKICAKNFDLKDSLSYASSGTSGIPLQNPYEKRAKLKQFIHFFIDQVECGVKITDRQVVIGADWIMANKIQDVVNIFPCKRLDPSQRPEEMLKQIREYKPKIMVAYPSSAMIIAKEIKENDVTDVNIEKVFLSGENLDPYSKKIIEDTYNAEVFEGYGANEVGGIADQCAQHNYHVWGDSVIPEILKDGEPVSVGEEGEIIVTGTSNYLNPFLRYNCKDLGKFTDRKCSCNNHYPLLELVQGRSSDFIYLADGAILSALGVYDDFNAIPGVKQFQVTQETMDKFTIKIVKEKKVTSGKIIDEITKRFEKKLGKVNINVEVVEDIPKQHTGKLVIFISHLKVGSKK